jgi:hypothetical protein
MQQWAGKSLIREDRQVPSYRPFSGVSCQYRFRCLNYVQRSFKSPSSAVCNMGCLLGLPHCLPPYDGVVCVFDVVHCRHWPDRHSQETNPHGIAGAAFCVVAGIVV